MTQQLMIQGLETPRIHTPELRPLVAGTRKRNYADRTTDGFLLIEFAQDYLDLALMPWQKWLLIHALELIDDGLGNLVPRFSTVVVMMGRQSGKTLMLELLVLWTLFGDEKRTTVLGSAQDLSKAEDTWRLVVERAECSPELSKFFGPEGIVRGHPKIFGAYDGSEYRVVSTGSDSGRGYTVDLAVFDELRTHTDFDNWSSITNLEISPECECSRDVSR